MDELFNKFKEILSNGKEMKAANFAERYGFVIPFSDAEKLNTFEKKKIEKKTRKSEYIW